MLLADDTLAQRFAQAQNRVELVLDHAADGNAGPVCHHAGHGLSIDRGHDQWRVALQGCKLFLHAVQFAQQGFAAAWCVGGCCCLGIHRLATGAQFLAQRKHLLDDGFLFVPTHLQLGQPFALKPELLGDFAAAAADVHAHRGFAADDAFLDFQRLDAPHAVFDFGRRGVLAHRNSGTGGVEQAHRFVGQLARRDVAVRQPDGALDRLVQKLHAVVFFQHAGNTAQHQDGFVFVGFGHLHHLETARQSRILLDVLFVLGPGRGADGAQGAARQSRLEKIGGIAGARRAAGADQGVHFVDEQDDGFGRRLHLVDDLAQALFEFAFHARAGLKQAQVQRQQRHVLQLRRHIATRQALCKSFDHRRLADARLAGKHGIVLPPPHEDVDDLADLFVAARHRVHLAFARALGQVDAELLQCLLLAHRRWRHCAGIGAGFTTDTGGQAAAVLRAELRLLGSAANLGEVVGQVIGLDAVELARNRK